MSSFGMDIGTVRRTRSFTGENTAALSKYAGKAEETEQTAPVSIKVEATLEGSTYSLVVAAEGQSATRSGVDPADLADVLASVIDRLAKHAAAGDLKKHRQPQEPTFRGTDFTRKPKSDVFSGDRA